MTKCNPDSAPQQPRSVKRGFFSKWDFSLDPPVSGDVLEGELAQNSHPSFGFFFMLALSAVIATLGLIANSAAVIIGAMIIAPLMNPIIGASFCIVRGNTKLLIRNLTTILVGVAVVVGLSALTAGLVGSRIAGSEILARSNPNILDLGVAICAGIAGAFAVTRRKIANAIPGVAMAVALVPPLCVIGIGLSVTSSGSIVEVALSDLERIARVEVGSTILFLTNLSGIILFSAIVFLAQGYGKWKQASKGIVTTSIALGLLTIPLLSSMKWVLFRGAVQHSILEMSGENAQWAGANVIGITINQDVVPPQILLSVSALKGTIGPDDARIIEDGLEKRLGRDVSVDLLIYEYVSVKASGP